MACAASLAGPAAALASSAAAPTIASACDAFGVPIGADQISLNTMAEALFTDYALPFEVLSLLLLAAIIGAIYLARRPEDDERVN